MRSPRACSCSMNRWTMLCLCFMRRYLSVAFCNHDGTALKLGHLQSDYLQSRLANIRSMVRPALHLALYINSSGP